jgi:hypothetical protein
MNKAILLKEMGISSYKLRDIGAQPEVPHIKKLENKGMNTEFPLWTLMYEERDLLPSLWKDIQTVIQNFGVKIQVVPFQFQAMDSDQIQGQLLICFGEQSGQHYSGEITAVEGLREILFETTGAYDQDIPVIVSYSMKQIASSAQKKKKLWEDLIFARNVYLDTMS